MKQIHFFFNNLKEKKFIKPERRWWTYAPRAFGLMRA